MGAFVPMPASFRVEASSSFTGTQALTFKGKTAYRWQISGGVQRGVSLYVPLYVPCDPFMCPTPLCADPLYVPRGLKIYEPIHCRFRSRL